MKQKKGFSKDFILVLIGQIISLFGNAVMRFALPLHLLNVTGSSALLGVVSGCSFFSLVLMSPVGGLIADRINKKKIMVFLDFLTAGLVFLFTALYGKVNLIALMMVLLFLLYGISGAYQPSVQASIPVLVAEEKVMTANAVINMVSSLSSMLGPAIGGMVYQAWGIIPVLEVCIGCFVFSAVMEIFIHIPQEKRVRTQPLLKEAKSDMTESIHYLVKEKKQIGQLTVCCACVNLIFSALMVIGLPVIVMQMMVFPDGNNSQMYGFLEGIMAVGALAGGLGAGIFADKLKIQSSWKLLIAAAVLLVPIGLVLALSPSVYLTYWVMALTGLIIMALASIYSIQIMSYIQVTTPSHLIGKIIAWVIAISTCAQPFGQIVYGALFEWLKEMPWLIFFAATLISLWVGWYNRKIVKASFR